MLFYVVQKALRKNDGKKDDRDEGKNDDDMSVQKKDGKEIQDEEVLRRHESR